MLQVVKEMQTFYSLPLKIVITNTILAEVKRKQKFEDGEVPVKQIQAALNMTHILTL